MKLNYIKHPYLNSCQFVKLVASSFFQSWSGRIKYVKLLLFMFTILSQHYFYSAFNLYSYTLLSSPDFTIYLTSILCSPLDSFA